MAKRNTEYSFYKEMCDEFATIENIESKTLQYRFDMFIDASTNGLTNLKDGNLTKCIGDNGLPYINKSNRCKRDEQENFNMNFCLNYDHIRGKSAVLMGVYSYGNFTINMMFINYFDNDRRRRINELPFHIKNVTTREGNQYELEIKGNPKEVAQVVLKKYYDGTDKFDSIAFFVYVPEFGDVLKLVNTFTVSPSSVYKDYSNIVGSKRIMITYNDFERNLINIDDLYAEPVKGLKKLTRKIFK